MTLTSLFEGIDIWAPLPGQGMPKKLKGLIFVARANSILANALRAGVGHHLLRTGSVNRRNLALEVGCSTSTLTANKDIRRLLEETDDLIADITLDPKARNLRETILNLPEVDEENLGTTPINSTVSRVIYTSKEFTLYGKEYKGLPTILFADGIHVLSSNWLRHACVHLGLEVSTVCQYAEILRPFLLDLRRRGIALNEVTDKQLVEWRNKLERGNKRKRAHANISITTIFQFMMHCERKGDLTYRVGCYERHSLPEALRTTEFPISAELVFTRGATLKWATPLLFRTVPDSVGNRGTPTEEEMKSLHRLARRIRHSVRFTTILSIVEDTGARVSELLQLKASEIPGKTELDAMLEKPDARVEIEVIRKGGKPKPLYFDANTLLVARSYLKLREKIITTIQKRNPTYKPPDELFISEKTGEVLKPDSISKQFRRLAKWVGLRKIGIHRVRAKFAIDTIDRILAKYLQMGVQFEPGSGWVETILQQAAAEMGHENVNSLRYYLHAALDRRMRSLERASSTTRDASHVEADREEAEERMVRQMLETVDELTARETAPLLNNVLRFA